MMPYAMDREWADTQVRPYRLCARTARQDYCYVYERPVRSRILRLLHSGRTGRVDF